MQTAKQTVKLSDLKKQKAEYKRKQAANTIKLSDLEKQKAEYQARVAEEKAAQNDPVAKIERQISEARAGYAGKVAGAAVGAVTGAKNAISRAAEQKAAQIVADKDAEYAPQEVNAETRQKIAEIGASSRLKKGTELYKQQAKLRDEYLNAGTHNEQVVAKDKLDELQKKLPGKGLERAASAIGGGIVSLEAGVAKMLNPTAKNSEADRVLGNVEKANVTGKAGLGSVGGLMYDAVQTATNNVAAIGVGAATGGAVNPLALMGTSAAGSSVREAQQAGATDKVALATGTINGVLEAAFEKVPLDNLFKLAKGANADKLIKDGLKGYALSVARQAGLEGTSEMATTLAQNFTNRMMYEKSLHPEESWGDWWDDTSKDMAYSFLLGGLVGGTMGAPAAVAGRAQQISQARSEAAEKAQTVQSAAEFAAQGSEQSEENALAGNLQNAAAQSRAENTAQNAAQTQNEAAQTAQTAQVEEVPTGQEANAQSGQNLLAGNLQGEQNAVPERRTVVDTNPAGHTATQQAELARYVAATDEGLLDFANRYIEDGNAKFGRYTISDVGERQAAALQNVLGGDFSGYKNAINSDAIKHIDKRHGAKGEHDSTMREPADIARAGYVIANFDNVELLKNADGGQEYTGGFKGADNKVAPLVRFSKKINGNYYVVEAAADNKYKKLWVVSAYMGNDTKSGAVTQVSNADRSTLNITSETLPASPAPRGNVTQVLDAGISAPSSESSETPLASPLPDTSINNAGGVVKPGAENARGNARQEQNTTENARHAQNEARGDAQNAVGEEVSTGQERSGESGQNAQELAAAQKICDKLGLELRVARLPEGVQGHYANGVITISPNAESPVNEVFIHELTHHLERSGSYEQYAAFVTQEFERSYGKQALQSYKQQIKELYAEAGEQLTEDGATREMVAECTEDLLADEDMMHRLADFDGGLFRKIGNWLSDMAVKLKGTAAQKRAREAARRFEAALREMENAGQTTGGKGQYKINPKFASQLDSWDGKSDRTFELGTTSETLRSIGIDDRDIIWHSEKIRKIFSKHAGMSMNVIKQVPEVLENPIAVLKSKQAESRVAVFGEVQDELGAPVLAVLELNPHNRGGEVLSLNIVASAYGKDSNAANFVRKSEVLYIDPNKKRTDSWFQGLGLQLPSDKISYGSLGSVTYADGKVNIQGVPFEDLGKKIKEVSVTDTAQNNVPLSRFETSTDTSISQAGENVKGQNARRANKRRMLENAKKQQEKYDAEERQLRQMELEDEAKDAREEARAKVKAEDVKKGIYAGADRSFAVQELAKGAARLYGIPRGRIGEARAYVEEYSRAALERRRNGMNAAPTEELAAFLYDMGGVYDDTVPGSNIELMRAMDKSKVFVPADVRREVPEFGRVRKRSKLQIRTMVNPNTGKQQRSDWQSISRMYRELQEQFGEDIFPNLESDAEKLQKLVEVRSSADPGFLSWDEFDERTKMESWPGLQVKLDELAREFVDTVDKIDREKVNARGERAKDQKRLQTEAMALAKERCQGNEETGEPPVDVPEDMALQMANARYIKDPEAGMSLASRDLTGGLELVSRHNRALGEWLKGQFVRPLDEAKARYSRMLKEEMGKINAYMAEHGFVKGSAESAAIQRIGEGVRQLRKDELVDFGQKDFDKRMERLEQTREQVQDEGLKESDPVLWEQIQHLNDPKVLAEAEKRLQKWLADGKRPPDVGETVPYTLADLQREFPERWQEIKAAADFCRGIYDRVFDDIEAAYNRIYPNAAKKELERVLQSITNKTFYAEQQRIKAEADELAAARVEVRMEQNRKLAEKYRKQGKGESAARLKRLLKAQESAAKGLRAKANHRRDNAVMYIAVFAMYTQIWQKICPKTLVK